MCRRVKLSVVGSFWSFNIKEIYLNRIIIKLLWRTMDWILIRMSVVISGADVRRCIITKAEFYSRR